MDKKTERLLHLIKETQKEYGNDYFIFAIPGFLGRNFIAYCAMNQDLEILLKYIDELLYGNHSAILKSSLTYAIISLYGKCFTDASKHKSAKLEAKDLFKQQEKLIETHERLMKMRHHFIAHRGDTENEVSIAYMLVAMNGNKEQDQIKFRRLKQFGMSKEELLEIQSLVKYILEQLKPKIKKSGEKTHKALYENYTPEKITSMLMNNAK